MGVQDADTQSQVVPDQLHGLDQVRVVRDKYRYVKPTTMSVVKKVSSQIDIGPFFLRLDHLDGARPTGLRICQWHSARMRKEMPEVHFKTLQGPQCSQVCLLPDGLIRVAGPRTYESSEVFQAQNLAFRQKEAAQFAEVEPLVRCPANGSVVEIKAVDVDVRSQGG
jgi:hypothetical protein